ncbi:hypothetical protein METBIDRAFT_40424 [Metschnikowia bicuspidata var. bicuspidata NRRL YB-4993]|uniref:Coatomer subunit delta n=1 Tax=Metschnikowia bicuspidata var. bicuspidata NRRL YB-4993 TaxID=869754 RepID=A0A1A0HDJ7_9ASCO|nr:hypothetical protein METBIDRAFT_40424 [Metschnikowia bicuspidata var. bicuspidata NRRL YB-4993]OBA22159.1 hypothetical protein METBIDRAFT_40424 [Metschnikowia bicuspidata var. bicuspidata NRRL YB-4993]
MAVLAVSICSHGGKALVARQFRDLSQDRITELLAHFPSLLSGSGAQNTTVETDAVRYVYQPLEEYYVVLLTNKQSNILQDIDTLHLFVLVVSNMLRSIDEKEIYSNAFELLSAFDEIVNLGHREKLNLSQVQSFLEMDSHEEKIQDIIERNKEMEATEERRRRAKEIQRKELARRNMELQHAAVFGAAGQAPPAHNSLDAFGYTSAPSAGPLYGNPPRAPAETPGPGSAPPRPAAGKGLQLGKKPLRPAATEQKQPLLAARPPAAAPSPGIPEAASSASASPGPQQSGGAKAANAGILITLNEKITAQLHREGGVSASEVKGDLNLRINNAALARARLLLRVGTQAGIQYKTHPNVDRALFLADSSIGLKDRAKPFPSNDQSLGVLRWRAAAPADDASLVPLLLTAWVSVDGGVADVNLEYELTPAFLDAHPLVESFDGVQILVPVVSDDVILKEDSSGHVSYNATDDGVVFSLAHIDTAAALGSFEFSVPVDSEDSLFPMQIAFHLSRTSGVTESDGLFGKVLVIDVVSNDDEEESLPFNLHQNLTSESYSVV